MRKIPFTFKLFLSSMLVIAVFSAGVLYFTFERIEEFNLETAGSHLHSLGIASVREAQPLFAAGDWAGLQREMGDLGRRLGVRVTVVRLDGVVAADSEHDPASMDNHGSRPEIVGALSNQEGRSTRYSRTLQDTLMYLAMRFPESGPPAGVLRVSMRVRSVDALRAKLGQQIGWIAAFSLLVALLLAFVVSQRLGGPVRKLAWAAGRFSEGHFEERVFLKQHDELRELANGFNRMAEEVNRLFQELAHKSEEHRIILASIQEGLVVVDRDARIVHANEAFWRMVRSEPSEN
jgi:two-component system phosphate regulon sensor histidine kinase PhoR